MTQHEEDPQTEARFLLENMDIESVGLVQAGANNAEFILLKSKEGGNHMKDDILETAVEPVEAEVSKTEPEPPTAGANDAPAPGFWERITSIVRGEITAANEVEKVEEETAPDEKETDEVEMEKQADTVNLDALQAIQKAHLEQIEKVHQGQMEAVEKRLDEQYKGQITDLVERVEKAEQNEADATQARVKREFVEKAISYRALPVKPQQLGDLLYKASEKLEPADFEQLEALLTAADNQLAMASIFKEIGHATTPEEVALDEKITKATEEHDGDVGAALLSLPKTEQLELAAKMREDK